MRYSKALLVSLVDSDSHHVLFSSLPQQAAKIHTHTCNGLWTFEYSLAIIIVKQTQLNKKCYYLHTETNNKQKKNDEAESKSNNTMISTKSIKLMTYSLTHTVT